MKLFEFLFLLLRIYTLYIQGITRNSFLTERFRLLHHLLMHWIMRAKSTTGCAEPGCILANGKQKHVLRKQADTVNIKCTENENRKTIDSLFGSGTGAKESKDGKKCKKKTAPSWKICENEKLRTIVLCEEKKLWLSYMYCVVLSSSLAFALSIIQGHAILFTLVCELGCCTLKRKRAGRKCWWFP